MENFPLARALLNLWDREKWADKLAEQAAKHARAGDQRRALLWLGGVTAERDGYANALGRLRDLQRERALLGIGV